jgi:hypothetical protein
MLVQAALIPLFVEVGLTFGLLIWSVFLRGGAFRDGLDWRNVALGQPNWPPRATQVANAYGNQFELPVLFYILTVLTIVLRKADFLFVIMAWLFVLTRLVHAVVHVTSNRVPLRGAIFGVGALILLLMWLIFAVRVLLAL